MTLSCVCQLFLRFRKTGFLVLNTVVVVVYLFTYTQVEREARLNMHVIIYN